jgi:cardiolipin synthase
MQRARAGVKVRVLLDGFGVWLGGHFDLGSLRAAASRSSSSCRVQVGGARPEPAQPTAKMLLVDGDALLGRRPQTSPASIRSAMRGREPPWHDSASTCAERGARERSSASSSTGTTRRTCRRRALRGVRDDGGTAAAPRAQLIPSGPDQVDDTVHALLVSGSVHGARAHPRGHAVFRARCDLADGADPGGARGIAVDLVLPARSQPPPCRRRAQPAAARPRAWPARASG